MRLIACDKLFQIEEEEALALPASEEDQGSADDLAGRPAILGKRRSTDSAAGEQHWIVNVVVTIPHVSSGCKDKPCLHHCCTQLQSSCCT